MERYTSEVTPVRPLVSELRTREAYTPLHNYRLRQLERDYGALSAQ